MNLGSVFADDAENREGRGRDLQWEIAVPPTALGTSDGACVRVPNDLPVREAAELTAPRAKHSTDPEGCIVLHLPREFQSGAALRLRGYGEQGERTAGDLYLVIRVDPAATTALVRQATSGGAHPGWWFVVAAVVSTLGYVLFGG